MYCQFSFLYISVYVADLHFLMNRSGPQYILCTLESHFRCYDWSIYVLKSTEFSRSTIFSYLSSQYFWIEFKPFELRWWKHLFHVGRIALIQDSNYTFSSGHNYCSMCCVWNSLFALVHFLKANYYIIVLNNSETWSVFAFLFCVLS